MKKMLFHVCVICGIQLCRAQDYSIGWHQIAGGGGPGAGGTFSLSGTIGQPNARAPMTGGDYSVTGGFWSLINVVPMPGAPKLIIVPNGANSVKILWPGTGGYTLQQNGNLASTNWVTSSFAITNGFGTNFCTITPPVGNLFFRLSNP